MEFDIVDLSQRTTFEYRVVSLASANDILDRIKWLLDEAGAEGWELVTIVAYRAYFKRVKNG